MKYAQRTVVSVQDSLAELENMLARAGAISFGRQWESEARTTTVHFAVRGASYRLAVAMPPHGDKAFALDRHGRARAAGPALAAWEQEHRRRWRAVVLLVKAKLVAVAEGTSSLEHQFLADMVLPDGCTVSQWIAPQFGAITRGAMPGAARALPAAVTDPDDEKDGATR